MPHDLYVACPFCNRDSRVPNAPPHGALVKTWTEEPDAWYRHDNPSHVFIEDRCAQTRQRFLIEFAPARER